jgi:hypothetical protein
MKNKSETDALNEAIIKLKYRRIYELQLLKEQFHETYESLRPINLIKSTFHEVTTSPEIKNTILDNVIGLGTGIISKKLLIGNSRNPIKKLLGTVLEFAVAGIVSKHADGVKATGESILHRLLNFKKVK